MSIGCKGRWEYAAAASKMAGVSKPQLRKLARDGYIGTMLMPGMKKRRYSVEDIARLQELGTTLARMAVQELQSA